MLLDNYIEWIDAAWIPIVLLVVRKGQRLVALGFILANMFMMRLIIELMYSIEHPFGILPILDYPLFFRGLASYGLVYIFYMALGYFSPRTERVFFLGASVSLFFFASFAFAILSVL